MSAVKSGSELLAAGPERLIERTRKLSRLSGANVLTPDAPGMPGTP